MTEQFRSENEPVSDNTVPLQPKSRERPTEQMFPEGGDKTPRRDLVFLTKELVADLQRMFKQETQLLRKEVGEKLGSVKAGGALLTAGGVTAFVGVQALIATIIIALGNAIPLWLSALIVSAVLLIAGGVMAYTGKAKIDPASLKPEKSAQSLHEIGDMLQGHAHDVKEDFRKSV